MSGKKDLLDELLASGDITKAVYNKKLKELNVPAGKKASKKPAARQRFNKTSISKADYKSIGFTGKHDGIQYARSKSLDARNYKTKEAFKLALTVELSKDKLAKMQKEREERKEEQKERKKNIDKLKKQFEEAKKRGKGPVVAGDVKSKEEKEISAGKHSISFVFNFTVRKYNRSYSKFYTYKREELVVANKTLKKKRQLSDLIEEISADFLERYYTYESYIQQDGVTNVQVTSLKGGNLGAVRMRFTTLAYNLLGSVDKITKNTGQCVIDYLVYECQRTKTFHSWTRQKLIKHFGEDCIIDGITTDEIIRWAKQLNYVSVHAIAPLMKEFESHIADRPRMVLCFIVNNDHLYPVVDSVLKDEVARTKHIAINNIVFDVKFDSHAYVNEREMEANKEAIYEGKYSKEPVLLFETNNLAYIVNDVMTWTQTIVLNMKFARSNIIAFEHPITKQIYLASQDYEDRKRVCQAMQAKCGSHKFEFQNQSFTQLAKDWFQVRFGTITDSEYSPEYMDILANYALAPYITQVRPEIRKKFDDHEIESFDICRDYTSILIENETPFNVFSCFDEVRPFTGQELVPGEYYINKTILMGKNTIKLSRGWYPLVFVKYALENEYITKKNIKFVQAASSSLKADVFKSFASGLFEMFPIESKQLNNCFIGDLNTISKRQMRGCVTDSYEVAMGLYFGEVQEGMQPKVFKVQDLFFIRSKMETRMTNGNVPIWRHIIASSYIKLDKLHKAVCNKATQFICYNTDSIKVVAPRPSIYEKLSVEPKPGDIRLEEDAQDIRGRYFDQLPEHEEYELKVQKQNMMKENEYNYQKIVERTQERSCLVIGEPGSGKTEMIKNCTNEETDIVLSFTNKACNVLNSRGVKAQTLDSVFMKQNSDKNVLEKLAKKDSIIVDEFSMVPPKYFAQLHKVKQINPKIKIKLFGDVSQLPPVEPTGKWYDYSSSKLIQHLVDNQQIELKYKFTRYDASLHDVLQYFKQVNKLPDTCKDKTRKKCYVNICATNNKRKEINESTFERFVEEFDPETKTLNKRLWATSMPIIAIDNKLKKAFGICNSEMFKIEKFSKTKVIIRDEKKRFKIPIENFGSFDYGFCTTIHKYQGSEIKEEYCIHEMNRLSKNALYTALSRGITLDNVHFKYTTRWFAPARPSRKCIDKPVSPLLVKDGKIYKITNGTNDVYIGLTTNTLEERLAEHKENPTSDKMKQYLKTNVKIELLEAVPCTSDKDLQAAETRWIQSYQDKGYDLMNTKKVKRDKFNVQIVQDAHITVERFQIRDDEKESAFRLQYRDAEGNKKQKKFRYGNSCTKEQAEKKAEAARAELIRQMY